jgi:hypothetical protein
MTEAERARFHVFEPCGMWGVEALSALKLSDLAIAKVPVEDALIQVQHSIQYNTQYSIQYTV